LAIRAGAAMCQAWRIAPEPG